MAISAEHQTVAHFFKIPKNHRQDTLGVGCEFADSHTRLLAKARGPQIKLRNIPEGLTLFNRVFIRNTIIKEGSCRDHDNGEGARGYYSLECFFHFSAILYAASRLSVYFPHQGIIV
ncbi:MAG: hypothetical protein ACI89Z_000200 [Porticoccus sp.]|jgi:hypothetical protein